MNTVASGLSSFFTQDHRDCDASWAEVEAAVDAGDHELAMAAWQRFDKSLRAHFAMEEDVIFPADKIYNRGTENDSG